jgi:predicted enzyme related to lactoylglutathione lyase
MGAFKLLKITVACSNISAMTEFYSSVFNVKFQGHDFGFKVYSAKICDIYFLFCPNDVAGVKAEQNRHQFDYITDEIEKVIERALSTGGAIHSELLKEGNESTVTLLDPDGNTINFIQRK